MTYSRADERGEKGGKKCKITVCEEKNGLPVNI